MHELGADRITVPARRGKLFPCFGGAGAAVGSPESASGKIIPSVGAADASTPVGGHGPVLEAGFCLAPVCADIKIGPKPAGSECGQVATKSVQPGPNHSHAAWNCDVFLSFCESSRERPRERNTRKCFHKYWSIHLGQQPNATWSSKLPQRHDGLSCGLSSQHRVLASSPNRALCLCPLCVTFSEPNSSFQMGCSTKCAMLMRCSVAA